MRITAIVLGIAAAASLAAAAGCGGGDAASGQPGASNYPSKRIQYTRGNQANAEILRDALAKAGGGAAAGGSVAQAVQADGWADITGSIKLQGSAPAMSTLEITKDGQVCAPGDKPVLDESMIVSSDGGLANVLVFVASKVSDAWEHPDHQARKASELTGEEAFDQKFCVFLPHVFAMRSTQRLQILNSDPIGHNTNISEFGFNETIGANDSTFFAPGSETRTPFQVRCSIHPWMKAWMITRGNPYFAVSGPDGSFTIPKVPAGVDLEFRVWHERSKLGSFTLNGAAASGGKFMLKLAKDAPQTLSLQVDAAQFE
ncbi:MAG: hypothetical protein J5I93_19530 [Pirellulaceae bacterium]|nr:hypothetical protein [Pirellulaceae bacterium]